jgi:hypothetical protein
MRWWFLQKAPALQPFVCPPTDCCLRAWQFHSHIKFCFWKSHFIATGWTRIATKSQWNETVKGCVMLQL